MEKKNKDATLNKNDNGDTLKEADKDGITDNVS